MNSPFDGSMTAFQLQLLIDTLPTLAWVANADGFITWYNRRWHDYCGTTPAEMEGWGWQSVHDPAVLPLVLERWTASIASGADFEMTFPIRGQDGVYRPFLTRVAPLRDDFGTVIRWVGTNTDISPQHAAETALQVERAAAEARALEIATILGQLAEGVIVTDAYGRVTFVNDAAADIHGVRRLDVAPEEYATTYHLFTNDGLPFPPAELPLARAVLGETVFDARWQIHRPDGKVVCALGSARPLRSVDGQQTGAVITIRDDTARHRAETELHALNATLEARVVARTEELARAEETLRQAQKMEAVGQLTGGIAHDFNNMLSVVIGSLDLLGRRLSPDDVRTRRYVDAATDGAKRAATLTQRLLAFSRQQPLQPEPVDVNRLVKGMSDLLRHSLGGAVRLEAVLGGGIWQINADPNQLENVILNLGINGRDAMPDGGRLTIETENAHLDDRYVASEIGMSPGQYVLIAVTDTGSGMPAEVVAKAFDPFFTTKGVGKGTGLGLSQVYGFVKQSGGHVKIYSEPGVGTTVKLYLPRFVGDTPQAGATEAQTIAYGDAQELILVVEDEPAVRQYSVDALLELGYRVLEADGAEAALRLIDEHADIALLFTDIVMPEINGARLAETARRKRPMLKILFTTGYTRNAVVHNGVVDAGVDLIGKPFTVNDLAAKVRAILDRPVELT